MTHLKCQTLCQPKKKRCHLSLPRALAQIIEVIPDGKSLANKRCVAALLRLRRSLPYLGLHCQRRDQREPSETDLGKLAGLCSGPASGNWVRSDVQKLILPPHSAALSEAVNLGRPEGTRSDLRKNSASYLLVHICWALQMGVSKKNSSQKSLTNISVCLFTRLILTFTKGSNISGFLGTLSWFRFAFFARRPFCHIQRNKLTFCLPQRAFS